MLSKEYKSTRELLGALMEGGEAVKRDNPRGNETSYFFMVPKAQSPTGEEVINVPDGVDPQAFKAAGYKVPETASASTSGPGSTGNSSTSSWGSSSSPTSSWGGMSNPTSSWSNINSSSSGWGSSTSGLGSTQSSGFGTQNPWGSTNSGLGSSSNSWGSNNGFGNGQNSLYTDSLSQSRLFGSNLSSLNNGMQGLNTSLYNTYLSPQIQLSDGVQVASNGQTAPARPQMTNEEKRAIDTRMRQQMLRELASPLHEGLKQTPHIDTRCNYGIGIGTLIKDKKEFEEMYNWLNPSENPAEATLIEEAWQNGQKLIDKNKVIKKGKAYCSNIPTADEQALKYGMGGIHISKEDAEKLADEFLVNETFPQIKRSLRNMGKDYYADFSDSGRKLMAHGQYNLGKGPNAIPLVREGILNNDWEKVCRGYIPSTMGKDRVADFLEKCRIEQGFQDERIKKK